MRKWLWTVLPALVIPLAFAGCGGGSDDSSDTGGGGNRFVGEWHVSGSEGNYYVTFKADYSMYMADSPGGSAHMTGTYTVDGDTASGPLNNPGVGAAEFIATLTGSTTMDYEFIEHWHNPYKHVPLVGTKL
jgi:hypothetical protein